MSVILGILFGALAVILPLVSFVVWGFVFMKLFRYSSEQFPQTIFLRGWGATARYISIGMIPLFIIAASLLSAGISIVFEMIFMVIVSLILSAQGGIALVLSLMSAGPIEESAKLLCSAMIYMLIFLVWKSRPEMSKERNRIKDGMIIGLIAGSSFGLLESVLYLFSGFDLLLTSSPTISTVDPIVWRITLGVSIHALWTGISSTGLGRSTLKRKLGYSAVFLMVAVVFHSLNNGVQGFFYYILDMKGTTGLVITDIIQFSMVVMGIVIFILLWKKAKKKEGAHDVR
ncbi:MAG: PrsW family glutamic-type intramembrane protease [Thermoplasmatota archaeon]